MTLVAVPEVVSNTTQFESLAGMTLGVHPALLHSDKRWIGSPFSPYERDRMSDTLMDARLAGVVLQEVLSPGELDTSSDAYMFAAFQAKKPTPEESQAIADLGIRTPVIHDIDELLSNNDMPFPYVVANYTRDSGVEKMLVETERQRSLVRDYLWDTWDAHRKYELREFIETPSNRNTSYRVLVDGGGVIVGAGLLYSREPDLYTEHESDFTLQRQRFVSRAGLDAIRSRNIRSNVSMGGRIVPLMGRFAETPHLTFLESEILNAHGIEPLHPELPYDVAGQARAIGELVCRDNAIVIGVDFIADVHADNEPVFLEYNNLPGTKTFHACHYKDELHDIDVLRPQMYELGLRLLANRRAAA